MAKEAIKRMDDSIDLTDAIKASLPSIVAQNAAKDNANLQVAQEGNQGQQQQAQPQPGPAAPGHPMGGHAASPEEMAGGQMTPSNGELTP
jgi:hypothetical protein